MQSQSLALREQGYNFDSYGMDNAYGSGSDMIIGILAGGLGSRPLQETTVKPMPSVEVIEAANIHHHKNSHSLLIPDEIGRGTNTCYGLSIAWGIIEYIHNRPNRGAGTIAV